MICLLNWFGFLSVISYMMAEKYPSFLDSTPKKGRINQNSNQHSYENPNAKPRIYN